MISGRILTSGPSQPAWFHSTRCQSCSRPQSRMMLANGIEAFSINVLEHCLSRLTGWIKHRASRATTGYLSNFSVLSSVSQSPGAAWRGEGEAMAIPTAPRSAAPRKERCGPLPTDVQIGGPTAAEKPRHLHDTGVQLFSAIVLLRWCFGSMAVQDCPDETTSFPEAFPGSLIGAAR
jgi:hypothetical protein